MDANAPSSRRRSAGPIPPAVRALCAAIPLLLLAATNATWLQLQEDERFSGYHRRDFIYYSANAREVFENGNGLVYGYPFSASGEAPRVYSHLQILLLGWVWKATGLPMPVVWQLAQLLFGVGMLLALWRLVELVLPAPGRVYAFAVTALGGGLATCHALARVAFGDGGEPEGFLQTVHVEGGGWFPNVFQNVLLATEAFYHLLAFWTFAAVLRRERGKALIGVLLLWWSHPFTGLEVAAIVGAFALLEALRERDAAAVGHAAAVAGVSLLFLAYYVLGLRWLSPEAADILDRWRTAPYLLELSRAPAMWGLFLAWPLFLLRRRPPPLLDWSGRRSDRFLGVWLAVVAVLLLHDRLLPDSVDPYQPMHFAHGYFFLPMALLTLRGLLQWTESWPRTRRRAAAAAFLAFVCVDNLVFTLQVVAEKPVFSRDAGILLDRLAEEESPTNVLTVGRIPLFRDMLGVATPHRSYILNAFQTAWFGRKREALREIALGEEPPSALAAELGIGWVAGRASLLGRFAADVRAGRAELVLRSGPLVLLRIREPIADRPPDYERRRFPPAW